MLGCDLIYRHTGSDFMLHKVKGFGPAGDMLESTEFDGISVKTKGINVYYISITSVSPIRQPSPKARSSGRVAAPGASGFLIRITSWILIRSHCPTP